MKLEEKGFREYDARWLYPEQIDDAGMKQLGLALGCFLSEQGRTQIIVGEDYRSYSKAVKDALVSGLVESGREVLDIGLCLSPTAYFAQSFLGVASVAMVTASHNENGWTGVKMGCDAPLTFGPDEMGRLKALALDSSLAKSKIRGVIKKIDSIQAAYKKDLSEKVALERRLRVVLSCGNGTAGAFAPEVFERAGCEVIALNCELDWNFPLWTPNPENMKMMHALAAKVKESGADLGLAFDGDGDRCGFVDEKGNIIFADKMGVLIARHLATIHPNGAFIADVKSTGLFQTDPALKQNRTTYWKTGHSYMKRKVHDSGAIAGFEKSGHFFFAPPLGRGYDDGLLSGLLVCALVAASKQPLSEIYATLPPTFISPSMAPFCADEKKYQAIEKIAAVYKKRDTVAGRKITKRLEVNGIRLGLEDGSWILARASSNVPSLVIVLESTQSDADKHALFEDIQQVLAQIEEIGAFDQKL